MIKNRSSKYTGNNEFWHDGREVLLNRTWGGMSFHGPRKTIVVVGEEMFYQDTFYYILVECITGANESITNLLDAATRIQAEYKVDRWFGILDKNVREIIAICNKSFYNDGMRNVFVSEVPHIGEHIDENFSLVHRLLLPESKRLIMFGETMIPAEMLQVPINDIRKDDFPLSAALSSVISSFQKYSPERDTVSMIPEPEGDF